jgi:energy-coupling factor transport system substrate-specific component
MLAAVQVALAVLPNIELVSALIIACTLLLGLRALYPVYVFVLLEGLLYGFGAWFVCYLYVWAALVLLTWALRRALFGALSWALLCGMFGLVFGALCALPYLFVGGWPAALAYWVSGIPFDLLHGAGNTLACALLLRPCTRVLRAGFTAYGVACKE